MKKITKTALLIAGATLFFGGIAVTSACLCAHENAICVKAEEEVPETDEEIVEEPEVVEEQQPLTPVEKIEQLIQKAWDTYLVPLLSGVSLTTIGSALITIAFTFIKNKMLDKKVLSVEEKAKEAEQKANEKYNLCVEKLGQITDFLVKANEMYELIAHANELNEDTHDKIVGGIKEMIAMIKTISNGMLNVDKLNELVKLLVQLETKVALQSKNVIQSGIVEDVNEIVALVKTF